MPPTDGDRVTEACGGRAQDGAHNQPNTGATHMTSNIGSIDRVLRILVGLGLISLVFVGPQTAWGWIGVVPLATALIGWCPAYSLLGIKTCKTS